MLEKETTLNTLLHNIGLNDTVFQRHIYGIVIHLRWMLFQKK